MIGSKDAVGRLALAIEDASYIVRKNAVRSLGQIGGAAAEKAIERAVSDSHQMVSKMAAEALARIRSGKPPA